MTDAHSERRYPPIGDYGFIGDCHSAALVSRTGSIDWCCMPRVDRGSCFGRLLDWDRGGYCLVTAVDSGTEVTRSYVENTMVLQTTFRTGTGEARLYDCFTAHRGGRAEPHRQLLRIVVGVRGQVDMAVVVAARFDYGDGAPWVRRHRPRVWSAVGGDDALLISTGVDLELHDHHELRAVTTLGAGQRLHLSIVSYAPEELDPEPPPQPGDDALDERLEATAEWWRAWATAGTDAHQGADAAHVRRSALVLKTLTNAPTGAIAAAPTTSLPEAVGADRNWDYRFSWIRDSQFTVRSLAELGFDREAAGLRRFIERTAAGSPEDLQIVYGLNGRRRLTETTLPLEGYRGSRPVHIGNAASEQLQLDVYGEILDLAWQWHERGRSPDDDYWQFLIGIVDAAAERWDEPDRGLWEMRGEPRHFVHSKVMCWAALDRGIRLARECNRDAPIARWCAVRDEIRASVEAHGVDRNRNCYVQAYGTTDLDAALLLLPSVDYLAYDDPRMVATTDAITSDLDDNGLLRRYRGEDGLGGDEGVFVACTFWLVECLAHQGRPRVARAAYERATRTANDLGLYSEEYDTRHHELLGNFPQGLSHLSHIAAAVALARREATETYRLSPPRSEA